MLAWQSLSVCLVAIAFGHYEVLTQTEQENADYPAVNIGIDAFMQMTLTLTMMPSIFTLIHAGLFPPMLILCIMYGKLVNPRSEFSSLCFLCRSALKAFFRILAFRIN